MALVCFQYPLKSINSEEQGFPIEFGEISLQQEVEQDAEDRIQVPLRESFWNSIVIQPSLPLFHLEDKVELVGRVLMALLHQ